jgi:hypothetical protein
MANEPAPVGKSGLTDQIKQDSRQKLETSKRTAAEQIEGVAQALDSARARLDESQPNLAAYAGQIATGVSNLATRLRDGSVEELLDDTRRLARRNPALFLAGGVALGFALSRFVKSSAESSAQSAGEGGYAGNEESSAFASGSEGTYAEPGGASYSSAQTGEPRSNGG